MRCVLSISEEILNVLVVVMILIVAIYTFISKNLGQEDNFEAVNKKNLRLGMLMALIMGFYDGFLVQVQELFDFWIYKNIWI